MIPHLFEFQSAWKREREREKALKTVNDSEPERKAKKCTSIKYLFLFHHVQRRRCEKRERKRRK
jgi:hypothetical protein